MSSALHTLDTPTPEDDKCGELRDALEGMLDVYADLPDAKRYEPNVWGGYPERVQSDHAKRIVRQARRALGRPEEEEA